MNFDPADYNQLKINGSPITGLFEVELDVRGDNRGWFKENYQKAKMEALVSQ
jgi:dTDP-4-dehydrorhamnose 3,5-epimerase